MTLKEIRDRLDASKTYRVTFYSQRPNSNGGWSMSGQWLNARRVTKEEVAALLNARLIIFRENYLEPREQEVDFSAINFCENSTDIDCNGIAFASIEDSID